MPTLTASRTDINIGISAEERKEMTGALSRLLADTYTLHLKTLNFHWNVTGPMFQTLHLMFEQQYNELGLAVDLIAERIRALGAPAPGSFRAYARLSTIPEGDGVPPAEEMIRELVAGTGGSRAHRTRSLRLRRQGQRPADRGPVDPADADTREDRLDAAKPSRVTETVRQGNTRPPESGGRSCVNAVEVAG